MELRKQINFLQEELTLVEQRLSEAEEEKKKMRLAQIEAEDAAKTASSQVVGNQEMEKNLAEAESKITEREKEL